MKPRDKLKVNFFEDEKEEEYLIIMGMNSIVVDSELVKIKQAVVKEDYFIY